MIKKISMEPIGANEAVLSIIVKGNVGPLGEAVQDAQTKPYDLVLKRIHEKRSLSANAYAWVLIDKLAEKLALSKSEVYREAIKDVPGVSDVYVIRNEAVRMLTEGWEREGLGWQVDTMPSSVPGYTEVILYTGSSSYNTKQMSALIDILVQECKAQGIETKSPDEIARMMEVYSEAHH